MPPAFSAPTRAWFSGAFAAPTPAQEGAWRAVASGDHALVVAPTGSGKTLAAFLWALDGLLTGERPAEPTERCRVVYVSPLKALAVDVERNLRSPLVGIEHAAARLGVGVNEVRVGVRTGDTPSTERRRFGTHPPDILITTPESLYLILTSAAREGLRGVGTVIVDEVHALAGSKRGAHLALSLERLDAMLPRPAQRVGLSATVRPPSTVAEFLAGTRPLADGGRAVQVVQPPSSKELRVDVVVPVRDLTEPDDGQTSAELDLTGDAAGSRPERRASVWPHLTERVLDLVEAHRSTIVFVNSRQAAERLTTRLNELWAERLGVPAADPGASWPAQTPAQSGTGSVPEHVVARVHHGSMSREERLRTESGLKSGALRAVVATSSLELGIDMGAVDLVVQVGAPPSVASTLQRIGRAGHQVGAVSHGIVLPTHRGELLPAAVTATRARAGEIEEVRIPTNPLDVLAQQIVAALAVEDLTVEEVAAMARRAAPFATLGERSLLAVLDMLAGRYPSEEFAELRARIVWDRTSGALRARPGALRLAATSGGTIPDRGQYGVFLAAGAEGAAERGGRRVGELDEEMVFESRVGDTITLGTSTWRIEEITPDRVLVSPAPGLPGRLPFWIGDAPGRPAELGAAVGATARALAADPAAEDRLRAQGLDAFATGNLLAYLREQLDATGHVPSDRTLVLEHFRDELGDWRVVLHSPYGSRVHRPWALVLGDRLRERTGMDVNAAAFDDGIVLRLPDTGEETDVAAELVLDPAEVNDAVVAAVGSSAHFAARFREAAARSLLLPRRRPDRRQPLWQQRHRAAQLLAVASRFPDFPVVLEAVRECLQDDFDVPALADLLRRIAAREVRLVTVTTTAPSPFARSLLLGYTGQFLYDGDAPLAERRAAALTLDPGLLAELVGADLGDPADLLDPEALAQVEQEVGLRTERWRATDAEGLVDLVRRLGPVRERDLAARAAPAGQVPAWLEALALDRRVLPVRVGGEERWIVLEDAGRVRDALGVALPVGLPEAVLAPVPDPLGDLLLRYARTHGPFTAADVAAHLGLGTGAVRPTLAAMTRAGTLVTGRLRPGAGHPEEFCDADVMRRIRRRSLARLRAEVEPVPPATLGVFLPRWQQVAPVGARPQLRGADGVLTVVDQLAGTLVPASAWESFVLPDRVADYHPGLLDEVMAAGEVLWAGSGALPGADGLLTLVPADAPELLPPRRELELAEAHRAVLAGLEGGGGRFFRDLLAAGDGEPGPLVEALWDLVWAGFVTNDTLAPLRARLAGGRTSHPTRRRPPRSRSALRRRAFAAALASAPVRDAPAVAGRWSLLPHDPTPHPAAVVARSAALLERNGVVVRSSHGVSDLPGGFAALYQVLRRLEEAGQVRRGYLVEGLGAAQFALPEVVDRLRSDAASREAGARRDPVVHVLAATDPASPYGAALPWPPAAVAHRPGRKAGAVVVLVDGELAVYVEKGGATLLSFTDDPDVLTAAARGLADRAGSGRMGRVTVKRVDGEEAPGPRTPLVDALLAAGFYTTPQGLRLREGAHARG